MQTYSLIAGIGNQGSEYASTFHNAGILAVEYLSRKYSQEVSAIHWESVRGKHFKFIRVREDLPMLVPIEFMNESGRGIKNALKYFGVSPDQLLVVHDDSDLPLGELKISSGQGPAGHKGIASIIDALGTKEFARARIGVRSTRYSGNTHIKAEDFVLKNMTKADYELLEETFQKLAAEIFGDSVGG